MKLLLILYTSLPALIAAVISADNLFVNVSGAALFILQIVIEFFLLNLEKKRPLIILTSVLAAVFSAIVIFSGFIHQLIYFRLLINLYQGPLLTIIFVLIFKLSRSQDFSKLSKGLNRLILLLFSYSAMLILLLIHRLLQNPLSAGEILLKLYEAFNYLPAVYFLWKLKNVFLSHIFIENEDIRYRNEDISSFFSEIELPILKKLITGKRIRCRDIIPILNNNNKRRQFNCSPGSQLATDCPAYPIIYRHIKSLDKKLGNLGIGMIIPPENRKNVIELGWTFKPEKGVQIVKRRPFPLRIPVVSEVYKSEARTDSGLITMLLLSITGSAALAVEAVYGAEGTLPRVIVPLLIAVFCFIIIFTLGRPVKVTGKSIIISITSLVITSFLLISVLSEQEVLMLVMKAIVLFVLCLMVRFPNLEKRSDISMLRERAPDWLFWLIWFYMVLLALFIDPGITFGISSTGMNTPMFLSFFINRIMLLLLFSLSARFFSMPQKPLVIKDSILDLNGRPLPACSGKDNFIIIKEFINNYEEPLHCYRILDMLNKEETSGCGGYCKSSICPHYQKIYKRIQTIRKYLQTTGIGTITSPERKAESHLEGWNLVLYDDVYIK